MSRIRRSRGLQAFTVAAIMSLALGIPATADLNLILGESAQVSYTQGSGVNVRDSIGFGGSVIATLNEGVAVTVLDGPVMADDGSYWYYVAAAGTEGWIISDYLALPPGSYATVVNTGGDGVNVRASASTGGGIITTLHEGTTVQIVDGPVTGDDGASWMLINFEGVEGWVHTNFVADAGSSGGSEAVVESARTTSASWTGYVVGTDGYGLRIRTAASLDSETLAVIPQGAAVNILASDIYGSDGSAWYNVEFEGIVGYSIASYFSDSEAVAEAPVAEQPAAEVPVAEPVVSTPVADGSLTPGVRAEVSGTGGGGINMRYESGYSAGVITVIRDGSVVAVLDGPIYDSSGSPWYQVEFNSMTGWVHGGYLVYTDAEPTGGAAVGAVDVVEEPEKEEVAPVVTNSVGDAIVAEGLRYVGLPYVWGGTTPAGFDCSGYTSYVLNNILDTSVSRSLEVQAVSGTYVDRGSLQPGDLVFFQNTYKWGLSHSGIYIGNNQFVHAGSERTGVLISGMDESYWGERYYTARRIR
ncbi:C40 family peptidase [soil metagenome]